MFDQLLGKRAHEPPPERKAATEWAALLDAEPPAVSAARCHDGYEAYQLEHLFSRGECERLIAAAEDVSSGCGFGRTNYPKKYRGNLRLITQDRGLAGAVWERMRALVPRMVRLGGEEWEAVGLNECWRLSRYSPGDVFQGHVDTCFERGPSETSMFTVNAYLNGGFEGGATRFFDVTGRDHRKVDFQCVPAAGRCVVFRQPPAERYMHDGEELRSGVKYLIRSDVMYRRKPQPRALSKDALRPRVAAVAVERPGAADLQTVCEVLQQTGRLKGPQSLGRPLTGEEQTAIADILEEGRDSEGQSDGPETPPVATQAPASA